MSWGYRDYWWLDIPKSNRPDFSTGSDNLPKATAEQYRKMNKKRRLSFLRKRLKARFSLKKGN